MRRMPAWKVNIGKMKKKINKYNIQFWFKFLRFCFFFFSYCFIIICNSHDLYRDHPGWMVTFSGFCIFNLAENVIQRIAWAFPITTIRPLNNTYLNNSFPGLFLHYYYYCFCVSCFQLSVELRYQILSKIHSNTYRIAFLLIAYRV